MIRRILDNVRRRNRLRMATIAMYNSGMCRHVYAQVWNKSQLAGDPILEIKYVHPCGDNCEWLKARRIVDEQIGAW